MADLMSTLATNLGETSTGILGALGDILPTALPVLGAVVAVRIGIKIYNMIIKKS